jgi:UDP-2-acetamido-2,6-beta-L-arabino-hexul-4-ose reductase
METEMQPLRLAEDIRGFVYEPITAAELAAQQNAHVVLTRPGGVRGNHHHERGTEIMAVMGPALVRIRDAAGIRDYPVSNRQVVRFTLPPKVAHAVLNTGTETGVIVSFNSWPHDPERPDVVREVLIESGELRTSRA